MVEIEKREHVITNGTSIEFQQAFDYIKSKVQKYFKSRYGKSLPISYADIGDYISGHLSTDGCVDVQWATKEWDLKDISEKVLDEILDFCQEKIDKRELYVE